MRLTSVEISPMSASVVLAVVELVGAVVVDVVDEEVGAVVVEVVDEDVEVDVDDEVELTGAVVVVDDDVVVDELVGTGHRRPVTSVGPVDESELLSASTATAMPPATTSVASTITTMPSGVPQIDGSSSSGPPVPSPPPPPPPPPYPSPPPPPSAPGTPGSTTQWRVGSSVAELGDRGDRVGDRMHRPRGFVGFAHLAPSSTSTSTPEPRWSVPGIRGADRAAGRLGSGDAEQAQLAPEEPAADDEEQHAERGPQVSDVDAAGQHRGEHRRGHEPSCERRRHRPVDVADQRVGQHRRAR